MMLFFFAEIIESGYINLMKTKCLEEGETVCQENIKLLIKELDLCREKLQSLKHSKFHLCKMDVLTAQTEIKPAKVIYAFSAPAILFSLAAFEVAPTSTSKMGMGKYQQLPLLFTW